MDEIMTPEELAGVLKIQPRTLYDWRLAGTGPRYVPLGRGKRADIRYRRRDVEEWMDRNTRTRTFEPGQK